MKILSLLVLLCAFLVLTQTAELGKAEAGPGEEQAEAEAIEESHVAKRAVYCPSGWAKYGSRCYYYVSASYTWAQAENYCVSQGGNLASVHSAGEYSWLQSYILSRTRGYPMTWIGGSDSEQEQYWFWSDGSRLSYRNFCAGMPRSNTGLNCIVMNASGCRCWFDYPCSYRYPFVCVRK